MTVREFRDVDSRDLRLPTTRPQGADPAKLWRQIAKRGRSVEGMPPLLVDEAADGVLVIRDGVTRATRAAKLAPGTPVPVEVVGRYPFPCGAYPTVEEMLP